MELLAKTKSAIELWALLIEALLIGFCIIDSLSRKRTGGKDVLDDSPPSKREKMQHKSLGIKMLFDIFAIAITNISDAGVVMVCLQTCLQVGKIGEMLSSFMSSLLNLFPNPIVNFVCYTSQPVILRTSYYVFHNLLIN